MNGKALLTCLASTCLLLSGGSQVHAYSRDGVSGNINVTIVTDEADAALAILGKHRHDQLISDEDWQRLFGTEGFIRLKKRDESFGRKVDQERFKSFLLSDSMRQREPALRATLTQWSNADVESAARLALQYLPQNSGIRAKIYPVIKPQSNSFVFEVTTDPAIFLYIDPSVSREKFENTLAHELHHIGFAQNCTSPELEKEIATLAKPSQTVVGWLRAFGEGAAMLAAAGGPDIHPHTVSLAAERERWDRDVASFETDFRAVEEFFLSVLDGRLSQPEEIQKTAFAFFGDAQGPWYTVGWKMAVEIERAFGRSKLIECLVDPRLLLVTYNQVAGAGTGGMTVWSDTVINSLYPLR